MQGFPDPAYIAASAFFALVAVLVFSMDIENARRALWSAYGQYKSQSSSQEASEQDLLAYERLENDAANERAREAQWPQAEHEQQNPFFDLADLDSGHFSEAEFLARFGGRWYFRIRAHVMPLRCDLIYQLYTQFISALKPRLLKN